VSQCNSFTMSQCYNVTMLQCYNKTVLCCHTIIMLQCYNVAIIQFFVITLLTVPKYLCDTSILFSLFTSWNNDIEYFLLFCGVTLCQCDSVSMWLCDNVRVCNGCWNVKRGHPDFGGLKNGLRSWADPEDLEGRRDLVQLWRPFWRATNFRWPQLSL